LQVTTTTVHNQCEGTPLWLDNFVNIYQSLAVDNLTNLTKLYHEDVTFQDPLHEIKGFKALADYFDNLYQNVSECTFVINQVLNKGNQAAIYWTMTYSHRRLNGGKPIAVEGHSLIMGHKDKVVYHRDYLDLGQMLYENIPLVGGIIRSIKRRMS
jgi:hypothetical protein